MNGRMPLLSWSPDALAAVPNQRDREEMRRLFDAYFRVAGEKSNDSLTGIILHLDLPAERKVASVDVPHSVVPGAPLRRPNKDRYHLYAKFAKNTGWVVQTTLRIEYRVVGKGEAHPH
jgi:hypothetical protein